MNQQYLYNVLIAIDRLGNTLAAGSPNSTISARTGYFANFADTPQKHWWRFMQIIIDTAFSPLHGPQHCLRAYEKNTEVQAEGNDMARAFLG